jgi:cob(I)alamin adenosyltransferase
VKEKTMTDTMTELATALADANAELNSHNHRDDQRIVEEAAERIQARVDTYQAAYDALEAHGLKKASEGAVKIAITEADAQAMQDRTASEYAESIGWQVAESTPLYSNGLDAPQED